MFYLSSNALQNWAHFISKEVGLFAVPSPALVGHVQAPHSVVYFETNSNKKVCETSVYTKEDWSSVELKIFNPSKLDW